MRWRRHRRRDTEAVERARREALEAQERLAAARRVGERVSEVADSLRDLQRRNRFGPMITEALRGHR